MAVEEIQQIVATALNCQVRSVQVKSDGIYVRDRSVDTSYDKLLVLAMALNTTDINIVFTEGERGWSEYTPGSPAEFYVRIGKGLNSTWEDA
jgi:hypothetical protein